VTIGITDSYRSYDEQVSLARRKGLYSQGGLAAKPGTSEHGWGMAADLDLNAKALSWMRANGARYGFEANVPRESWHWAYKPAS
jgi:LAS superfamily LD-carboxypeptidase LdcB